MLRGVVALKARTLPFGTQLGNAQPLKIESERRVRKLGGLRKETMARSTFRVLRDVDARLLQRADVCDTGGVSVRGGRGRRAAVAIVEAVKPEVPIVEDGEGRMVGGLVGEGCREDGRHAAGFSGETGARKVSSYRVNPSRPLSAGGGGRTWTPDRSTSDRGSQLRQMPLSNLPMVQGWGRSQRGVVAECDLQGFDRLVWGT